MDNKKWKPPCKALVDHPPYTRYDRVPCKLPPIVGGYCWHHSSKKSRQEHQKAKESKARGQ